MENFQLKAQYFIEYTERTNALRTVCWIVCVINKK